MMFKMAISASSECGDNPGMNRLQFKDKPSRAEASEHCNIKSASFFDAANLDFGDSDPNSRQVFQI